MYGLVMKGAVVVIVVMGLLIAVIPQKIVKKSMTETKKGLLTARLFGGCLAVLGLVALFMLSKINF